MYARPQTLPEAVAVLAGQGSVIVCGGTDIYPAHVGRPLPRKLIDVSAVAELRGIGETNTHIRIGGATSWSEILSASLPPAFDGLKLAAREVGSIQIQNRGSIAGNICNASPAADGIPPLLTLDAEVELASLRGVRRLALGSFMTGYRKTAIRPDEILAAVLVPKTFGNARSAFVKLGARKYLVISIVMVAALIRKDAAGNIAEARVAVGSASATAQRLPALERDLVGLPGAVSPSTRLRSEHLAPLSPIDDVRATAAYRRDAALHLVGEALDHAAEA